MPSDSTTPADADRDQHHHARPRADRRAGWAAADQRARDRDAGEREDDESGKEAVDRILEEAPAPGREVHAAGAGEIADRRRGVVLDHVERPHHVLVARRAPVRQVDRQDREARDHAGERETGRELAARAAAIPATRVTSTIADHDRREHHEVPGRVGHQHDRAGQQQRGPPGRRRAPRRSIASSASGSP